MVSSPSNNEEREEDDDDDDLSSMMSQPHDKQKLEAAAEAAMIPLKNDVKNKEDQTETETNSMASFIESLSSEGKISNAAQKLLVRIRAACIII